MARRALVISQDDRWHRNEDLGARIEAWSRQAGVVQVDATHDRGILGRPALDAYDACVLCASMEDLTDAEEDGVTAYVAAGKGLLGIHAATVTDPGREAYLDLIGARFDHHPPYAPFEVRVVVPDHPVVAGLDLLSVSDELYVLDRTPPNATVLAVAEGEGALQPMVYVKPYRERRVLYVALGHDEATYGHPAFRKLVLQGLAWVCGAGAGKGE